MTGDDRLRAMLGEIAAEAPIELRRSEQVWSRYRRTRRRAVLVAVGAAAALVSAVALVLPSGSTERGLVTDPTERPTASRAASQPSTTATAPASAVASAHPAASAPAESAPAVIEPSPTPTGGRAPEWAVGVLAHAIPSHAHAGDSVGVVLYPYAGDNGVDEYTIDWGDGTAPVTTKVGYCARDGDRYVVTTQHWEGAHRYAANGDYRITVTVRFAGCGGRPEQTSRTTTTVRVDDDPLGVEGPASPSIKLWSADVRSEPRPGKVAVTLDVTDPDSYVAFAFIHWGDGTATLLRGSVPGWCKDSPPALDPDWPAYVEHTYTRLGGYKAFAAVYTATCDGVATIGNGRGQEQPLHT